MFCNCCEQLINCAIDAKPTRRKPNLYLENLRSWCFVRARTRKVSKQQHKLPSNPNTGEFTPRRKVRNSGRTTTGNSRSSWGVMCSCPIHSQYPHHATPMYICTNTHTHTHTYYTHTHTHITLITHTCTHTPPKHPPTRFKGGKGLYLLHSPPSPPSPPLFPRALAS